MGAALFSQEDWVEVLEDGQVHQCVILRDEAIFDRKVGDKHVGDCFVPRKDAQGQESNNMAVLKDGVR